MQLTSTFACALLAFANVVFADSPKFGIVSIHSASPAHLLSLYDKNGLVLSGGLDALSSVITDDGKLKFSNGKYAVIGSDGRWTEGTEAEGSTGFAISDSELTYKGSSNFYAIPTSTAGSFYVSQTGASDAISIALSAWTPNGSHAPDYTPTGGDSNSVSASTSASVSAASTTKATAAAVSQIGDGQVQATTAATVAAISQIGDGQVQATHSVQLQSENGAAQYGVSAGALAVAAALLF
ncbi:Cwp1p PWA37_001542 [Arxiozyma heterogenica]|uniref:Cell wall protein CWP1 n=1 Tax=Arxiozyma heterogenica TaxID=278026 RepID=A0AAN7W2W3_9SACH|nr:hypothetical protein RI543_002621 [Kazachstania heterogenica]